MSVDTVDTRSPALVVALERLALDLGSRDRQVGIVAASLEGTHTHDRQAEERRAWALLDWEIRHRLPRWLRAAKLDKQAAKVEGWPTATPRSAPVILGNLVILARTLRGGQGVACIAGPSVRDVLADLVWSCAGLAADLVPEAQRPEIVREMGIRFAGMLLDMAKFKPVQPRLLCGCSDDSAIVEDGCVAYCLRCTAAANRAE